MQTVCKATMIKQKSIHVTKLQDMLRLRIFPAETSQRILSLRRIGFRHENAGLTCRPELPYGKEVKETLHAI